MTTGSILVVDDEASILRDTVVRYLNAQGHQASAAASAEGATEARVKPH